jgi:glycosyltransferase involved in cell wall biosynthesis
VHHGIDLTCFAFSATGGEDLVVLGRIHPDKGTADAIEIANQAGRRLKIAGPIQDLAYYEERVAPFIDDDKVRYLGSVGPEQRSFLLASAAALLHPFGFAEPFGLRRRGHGCGTPVVAYNKGAMPEVIDGLTGFLVDITSAVAASSRRLRSARRYPPHGRAALVPITWSTVTLLSMPRSW